MELWQAMIETLAARGELDDVDDAAIDQAARNAEALLEALEELEEAAGLEGGHDTVSAYLAALEDDVEDDGFITIYPRTRRRV